MLVDCGFTAITKQGVGSQSNPKMIARVVNHPELMLSNMTQVEKKISVYNFGRLQLKEIGFIEPTSDDKPVDESIHPVGSLLQLVPYHACATAACHPKYYVHDSQGIIREEWIPCRGW